VFRNTLFLPAIFTLNDCAVLIGSTLCLFVCGLLLGEFFSYVSYAVSLIGHMAFGRHINNTFIIISIINDWLRAGIRFPAEAVILITSAVSISVP
jgi:hypothetical protein